MKGCKAILLVILVILPVSCQPAKSVCPEDSTTYFQATTPPSSSSTATRGESTSDQISVEIRGKAIAFDRVIHGHLCNDTWKGTIYVACDVQVHAWTEKPTFLDNCDLVIEPGSVVYVAAHNNSAYYNGCSTCHTTGGVLTEQK